MGAILLIAFSVSSCTRAFITFYNKKDPMKKKSVWVKEEREIIHIPMIHIARQEYYDKVKQFITEKRQQGYAIYYEGVETGGETKQEQDTIMMKVRKILCINISGGYDDEKNIEINIYLISSKNLLIKKLYCCMEKLISGIYTPSSEKMALYQKKAIAAL